MLGRRRPGPPAGEPDQPAAAQHGGGGGPALHEGLRALQEHRLHRVGGRLETVIQPRRLYKKNLHASVCVFSVNVWAG